MTVSTFSGGRKVTCVFVCSKFGTRAPYTFTGTRELYSSRNSQAFPEVFHQSSDFVFSIKLFFAQREGAGMPIWNNFPLPVSYFRESVALLPRSPDTVLHCLFCLLCHGGRPLSCARSRRMCAVGRICHFWYPKHTNLTLTQPNPPLTPLPHPNRDSRYHCLRGPPCRVLTKHVHWYSNQQ